MNVSCPHCSTVFRVDPAKVPPGGVRARCALCREAFDVQAEGEQGERERSAGAALTERAEQEDSKEEATAATSAPAKGVAERSEPAATRHRPPEPRREPVSRPEPAAQTQQESARPEPVATDRPSPRPPPKEQSPPRPSAAPSPFGASDPDAKARRLARALMSDIVMYHPERRDQALREGTLKREFVEEITKSWEEYVEQVGNEMARKTPHFRDALNDILAQGRQVF